jgi:hypothetical protein
MANLALGLIALKHDIILPPLVCLPFVFLVICPWNKVLQVHIMYVVHLPIFHLQILYDNLNQPKMLEPLFFPFFYMMVKTLSRPYPWCKCLALKASPFRKNS